jgi:DNA mismatch endonuclease (patch repair protein)
VRVPRYEHLAPSSSRASEAARGSSKKRDTRCEVVLLQALRRVGFRRRFEESELTGRPDFVFRRERVVVFCDGDYWHGRDLQSRLARLAAGHNAAYWVAKIRSNVERDARVSATLQEEGWTVLRYWETDIHARADDIAHEIAARVRQQLRRR